VGAQGRNGMSSLLHSSIYIYIHMILQSSPEAKIKKKRERGEEGLSPTGWRRSLALLVGAPGPG
jgi:hypothetical protein